MKSLVKTITAYSFNELDEFARDKAKQSVLEKEHLPEFFSEDLRETLKTDFGLYHLNTYFSISSCQGDGLCLYGAITVSELFSNSKFTKIAFNGIHHKQIKSVYDVLQSIDFTHTGSYYHSKSVKIESYEYDPTEKQMAIIEKVISNVTAWYFTFCKEWEKRGYAYFYEISDENMQWVCNAYDYMFTKDGKCVDTNVYLEMTA